jgi:DNA-binding NarL/FixJ family response regulator
MKRTVLLADDHPGTLQAWRSLLEPEFEVIGSVGSGRALVDAHDRLVPDVVVTDIGMPDVNGIAAAQMILRRHPAARIVFVTVYAERAMLKRGLAAGAVGYVLKIQAGDDLVPAIRAALRGDVYISSFPPRDDKQGQR